jgi:hypothetical protein
MFCDFPAKLMILASMSFVGLALFVMLPTPTLKTCTLSVTNVTVFTLVGDINKIASLTDSGVTYLNPDGPAYTVVRTPDAFKKQLDDNSITWTTCSGIYITNPCHLPRVADKILLAVDDIRFIFYTSTAGLVFEGTKDRIPAIKALLNVH